MISKEITENIKWFDKINTLNFAQCLVLKAAIEADVEVNNFTGEIHNYNHLWELKKRCGLSEFYIKIKLSELVGLDIIQKSGDDYIILDTPETKVYYDILKKAGLEVD